MHILKGPCIFAKRYGQPHINSRAQRHTQASVIYLNNVDLETISRRHGHSRNSTAEDVYSHLLEQADDTAQDAIGNVLFDEKKRHFPTPGNSICKQD